MPQPTVDGVHVNTLPKGPRKARRLTNLRYQRIDLVDRGASIDSATGEGAHVVLFKRDAAMTEPTPVATPEMIAKVSGFRALFDQTMEKLGVKKAEPFPPEAPKAAAVETPPEAPKADPPKEPKDDKAVPATEGAWLADALGKLTQMLESFLAVRGKGPVDPALVQPLAVPQPLNPDPNAAPHAIPAVTMKGDPMAATETDKTPAPDDIQKRLDDATAESVELKKRLEVVEGIAKAEKDARLTAEYVAKCATFKGLPIKADDDHAVLREIDEKLSPDVAKRVTELLRAADAGMIAAGLFKAAGSDQSGGGTGDAWSEIDAKAQGLIAKADGKLDYSAAVDQVTKAHPDLYKRYVDEQRARH